MDPIRLEERFNDLTRLSLHLDAESIAEVDFAKGELSGSWSGDAAVEFGKQMSRVDTFMVQQLEQAAVAAHGVGMMYAISVQYRESFYDLLDKTIQVCRSVTEEKGQPGIKWLSVAADVLDSALDIVTFKAPVDLAKWVVDQVLAMLPSLGEEEVKGADALAVVGGYTDARDKLRGSYEDSVDRIGGWLEARRTDVGALGMPILEPKEFGGDVHSADFSYEKFFYEHHDPGAYAPAVERERKEYVAENPKGDGVIARRLTGEG